MTPMWRRLLSAVDWSRQAPRVATVVLASALVADLAHTVLRLRAPASVPEAAPVAPRQPVRTLASAGWRISHAHLFGGQPSSPQPLLSAANAPETRLDLALTGTIATGDPNGGFAILGAKGKPSHLYPTGESLGDGLSGRLHQTFVDHVVLELNGHLETLRLPHESVAGLMDTAGTRTPAAEEAAPPPPALADLGVDRAGRTPAEAWFELLHIQHQVVGNQAVGIKLRPDMRLQRQYDLRFNDVLMAVNGREISGPDSMTDLEDALKGAGKSLQLTVMRAGVEQVLTVSVADGT